ncbi:iron-containing alcohol dehydrogenase [Mesorhizobium sp. KR9-304]|uniref:iron-containing alcohol dehydrogenase n=1 Tax=Mesorhizobium sp. KR9-304 TaxID=3156614 RepID=UPI0032B41F76
MSKEMLDNLLAGKVRDPDGGGMLVPPLKDIVVARRLGEGAASLVARLSFGKSLAIIMDPDTRAALGAKVAVALAAAFAVEEVVLPRHPHPDMDAVNGVIARTTSADALVAVGSGSINDITKYAAHLTGRPFAVFGTAPSMNGYTSISAAITESGLKKSLPATLPKGVFLDLDVMAAAPRRLIASGFGDSLARATAQTDWLMAHLLLGKPYRETPFMLLADDEDAMISSAAALRAGDVAAVELLVRTLVMSGLGMTLCGGSYPASQGEHLIAHYIDMRGQNLPQAYHGEHISVTTLTMARLQERMLAMPVLQLAPTRDTEASMIETFGPEVGRACWAVFRPKVFDKGATDQLNRKLAQEWPEMRGRLRSVARPEAQLSDALLAVGAPTAPEDVGLPLPFYREAVSNARLIRDRFTMLDLAAMSAKPIEAGI